MFALEIHFGDGISQTEHIHIRRPQAVVGASDYAHVVIEDLHESGAEIRLFRQLGRCFRVVGSSKKHVDDQNLNFEQEFDGEGTLYVGTVRFVIAALDTDMIVRDNETPDKAGVRILRQACLSPAPLFPALVVKGAIPIVYSFAPDQPVYIGRAKQCNLRLESADISARHASIGFEKGAFWVEDLGSTNGTYVNGQQISGRVEVSSGSAIVIGREVAIEGVASQEQLQAGPARDIERENGQRDSDVQRYPALVAISEIARPARITLVSNSLTVIGRDPGSDMWLGAPHISRRHCRVTFRGDNSVAVEDSSTNGTMYDGGILRKGDVLEVSKPRVLDFGGGLTVAICFDDSEEQAFVSTGGALRTFYPGGLSESGGSGERTGLIPSLDSKVGRGGRILPMVLNEYNKVRQFYLALNPAGRILVVCFFIAGIAVIMVVMQLLWGLLR